MKKMIFNSKIVMCLCEILVGILLFIDPVGFTTRIIKVGGIILLVMGLLCAMKYFKTNPEDAQKEQNLAKALCALFGGLFCIFRSEWFIMTFPLLTIVYGVIILLTSIIRIQWTVDMFRQKKDKWYLAGIGAVLSMIFAGIILVNPFKTTAFLWSFVAVSLIVESVADLTALAVMNVAVNESD